MGNCQNAQGNPLEGRMMRTQGSYCNDGNQTCTREVHNPSYMQTQVEILGNVGIRKTPNNVSFFEVQKDRCPLKIAEDNKRMLQMSRKRKFSEEKQTLFQSLQFKQSFPENSPLLAQKSSTQRSRFDSYVKNIESASTRECIDPQNSQEWRELREKNIWTSQELEAQPTGEVLKIGKSGNISSSQKNKQNILKTPKSQEQKFKKQYFQRKKNQPYYSGVASSSPSSLCLIVSEDKSRPDELHSSDSDSDIFATKTSFQPSRRGDQTTQSKIDLQIDSQSSGNLDSFRKRVLM